MGPFLFYYCLQFLQEITVHKKPPKRLVLFIHVLHLENECI